jgi:hypothetical protein
MTEPSISAAQLASLVDSVNALLQVWRAVGSVPQGPRLSEFLSVDELRDLTGAARATKQAAWLKDQSIPHRLVGRRVIISREHVRSWLAGRNVPRSSGLNWAALEKK